MLRRTKLNILMPQRRLDKKFTCLSDMSSQDELEVAETLRALPELIASFKPFTEPENNSSTRNWKRRRTAVQFPPAPPRRKTYEELQEEYAELTERKEVFERELDKVRSYHEGLKAFNSLLRQEENKVLLQPSMAASASVKVEEDNQNQEMTVSQTIRTGDSRQE